MKYLALLYNNESSGPAPGTPEMDAQQAAYGQFFQEVDAAGAFKGGDPVQASTTASTVRVRDGVTKATAGPFNSGSEQLVGFYILECADQSQAEKYAAKIPAAATGAVEVRPIAVF